MVLGVILLIVGFVWLLVNLGVVNSAIWLLFWPLVLIYLGVTMLMSEQKNCCLMCKVLDKELTKIPAKVEKKVVKVESVKPAKKLFGRTIKKSARK